MALPADPSKSVHSAGKLVQQDMPHFQRDHALFNPYEHGLCDEEGRVFDQRMDPEFWVPPNTFLGKVNAVPPLKGAPPSGAASSVTKDMPRLVAPDPKSRSVALPDGRVSYTYSPSEVGKSFFHGPPPRPLQPSARVHATSAPLQPAPKPMMPTSKAVAPSKWNGKPAAPPPPKQAPYGASSKSKPAGPPPPSQGSVSDYVDHGPVARQGQPPRDFRHSAKSGLRRVGSTPHRPRSTPQPDASRDRRDTASHQGHHRRRHSSSRHDRSHPYARSSSLQDFRPPRRHSSRPDSVGSGSNRRERTPRHAAPVERSAPDTRLPKPPAMPPKSGLPPTSGPKPPTMRPPSGPPPVVTPPVMFPPKGPPPVATPPMAARSADPPPPPAKARPAEPKANRSVDPAAIESIAVDLFRRMLQRGEVQPLDGGASWRRAQQVAAAIAPDMRPVPAAASEQLSPEQQRMRQVDIDFNRMLADGTEHIYRRIQQDAEEAERRDQRNAAAAFAIAADFRASDAASSLDQNPLPSHGNRPAPSWTGSDYSSSDSDIATWGPALFDRDRRVGPLDPEPPMAVPKRPEHALPADPIRPAHAPKAVADQQMVLPGTSAHQRAADRVPPSTASSSSTYRGPC